MRIIDKNRDYYDYLQSGDDDRIVFDRRGSFTLEKETLCNAFNYISWDRTPYRFLLMQCGCAFWLFLAEITKRDRYGWPRDYSLELLTSWKDYSKERKLLDINVVNLKLPFVLPWKLPTKEDIYKSKDALQNVVTLGNYSRESNLSRSTKSVPFRGSFKKEELSYPLLKECGIAGLVSAQDIFVAIEEYFSMEKTESERTEPFGMTNDDKIEAHGFDTKVSFRGKR